MGSGLEGNVGRVRRIRWYAVAVVASAMLPRTVEAACAPDARESIETAPSAYIGHVVSTDSVDATVRVDEVWKGGDVGAEQTVHLEPCGASCAPGLERGFQQGQSYLFLSYGSDSITPATACGGFLLLTDAIRALRPASARTQATGSSLSALSIAGLGLVLLAAFGLISWLRSGLHNSPKGRVSGGWKG